LHWTERYSPRRLRVWLGRRIRLVNELGLWRGLAFAIRRRFGRAGATYQFKPRHARFPVYGRGGASDIDVFLQIFVDREYEPLCDPQQDVWLVIDCGANVGYASAFFLSQFPRCQVIAVEPDAGNFAMLERNLLEYGDRARAVRGGIWSHDVPLKVSHGRYRDGREWAVQVRECHANEEPDIQGVSIGSLLRSSGFSRISLLKIDIEGAEAVVFTENTDWLDHVDALAIELHDDSSFGPATEVFQAAIRGRGFAVSRHGEMTICRRVPTGSAPRPVR